jgi:hypothetical protein
VLPTGQIMIGFPGGPSYVDSPSRVRPVVPAGRYEVFISVVGGTSGWATFVFLTVRFSNGTAKRWKSAGSFFTDSGTGCVFDHSLTDALHRRRSEVGHEGWQNLKLGIQGDGDCSLVLDDVSGANAIVFKTLDWGYDCYLGHDDSDRPVCLVIDGRWRRWWEPWLFWR